MFAKPQTTTLIETSCNHLYRVWPTQDATLDHVWYGVEMKRTKAGLVEKTGRTEPVRKAATRVVQEA